MKTETVDCIHQSESLQEKGTQLTHQENIGSGNILVELQSNGISKIKINKYLQHKIHLLAKILLFFPL